jgi:hypothetical protein
MGFREQQCYIGHRVFAYGAYGAHSGEYGDDGRTISSMLRGLSELGVLPEKTENVPEYSQSLIKSWVKRYTLSQPPYNEYLNAAKKYRVTVGELDNTVDMHWNACFAGLTVCHGSYNLHTLKNGWYVSNGNGGHCRASAGWGTFNGVDYIGMVNSWGDGWGKISKSELTKLVNARYYEAFAIIDMQPMEAAKENYDMIPGQEVFNF